MARTNPCESVPIDPGKFRDPVVTLKGEQRAVVALTRLRTLWFNTGSRCNLACRGCYMDSYPGNDDLAPLSANEVAGFLDAAVAAGQPLEQVGFTGGEPFMNREIARMLAGALVRGLDVLVLTNAMKPMMNRRADLQDLRRRYGHRLVLRVSMDHYTGERHEEVRGPGTWAPLLAGIAWLHEHDVRITIAGRTCWGEPEDEARSGFARLFDRLGLALDAGNPSELVLFPELDAARDVPEITVNCWSLLGIRPDAMMCATSRMVIRRKGERQPGVVACTLLPYDPRFDLGPDLEAACRPIPLNHPHCARFCVLGGASCSV